MKSSPLCAEMRESIMAFIADTWKKNSEISKTEQFFHLRKDWARKLNPEREVDFIKITFCGK